MLERTLAIIKPDAWPQYGGAIITMATEAQLMPVKVLRVCRMQNGEHQKFGDGSCACSVNAWANFYYEHHDKPFFEPLVTFMSSGPSLAMVLEGEAAVARWRALMGPTDSRRASMETIRGKFGARMQMAPAPCPKAQDGRHRFASGERYLIAGWFCTACDRGLGAIRESDIARDTDYPMWRNAVHGSDSLEAATREIAFFGGVK